LNFVYTQTATGHERNYFNQNKQQFTLSLKKEMISVMKWIWISISIFGTFASNEALYGIVEENEEVASNTSSTKETDDIGMNSYYSGDIDANKKTTTDEQNYTSVELALQTSDIYGNSALHYAAQKGHEETVKLLLNVFSEEESEKLMEYVMKENKIKYTPLHYASQNGNEVIVRLLFHAFNEKERLIEYLTKESTTQYTAIHFAAQSGNQEIIKLFLNAFKKEEKEKLIGYLMKESRTKNSALHYAAKNGHEPIVKLLLNEFGKKEKYLLIGFLMKENDNRDKAIDVASRYGNENIVTLLSATFANVKNM